MTVTLCCWSWAMSGAAWDALYAYFAACFSLPAKPLCAGLTSAEQQANAAYWETICSYVVGPWHRVIRRHFSVFTSTFIEFSNSVVADRPGFVEFYSFIDMLQISKRMYVVPQTLIVTKWPKLSNVSVKCVKCGVYGLTCTTLKFGEFLQKVAECIFRHICAMYALYFASLFFLSQGMYRVSRVTLLI